MRDSTRRTDKYKKKIDGTISQLRLLRYGKEQKRGFKSVVTRQVEIERIVKGLIAGSANPMFNHFYCDFGKKVNQLMGKFGGSNLFTELDIATRVWRKRGLDDGLLCNIVEHFMPQYVCLRCARYGIDLYGTGKYC